jgi:hypothetical protein
MAVKKTELSAKRIRDIKSKGRYSVGGVPGLMLQVSPTSAKSWVLRVTIANRRRNIGIGGFPRGFAGLGKRKS